MCVTTREGAPGHIQYEEIWSHRTLFTTKRDVGQPRSGTNQSDQIKSDTLGKSVSESSIQHKNSGQAEDEFTKLNGTWKVIEATGNGELVPQAEIKGIRFVFHKDMLTWIGPNEKEEDEFRVRLGSQQQPQAIDLLQMPRAR